MIEYTKEEIEANAKHYRKLHETGMHKGKPIPKKYHIFIMNMCRMWEKELRKYDSQQRQRLLEIVFNGQTYEVNVRWIKTNEQHEYQEFDSIDQVCNFVREFYEEI